MSSQAAVVRAFNQKEKLAGVYSRCGWSDLAANVRACGKTYSFYVCHECGQYCHLSAYRCDDRLCAMCARERAHCLLARYREVFKNLKGVKMVTVSMRSRDQGELNQAVKELWDAFKRLRHRRIWKDVRGAVACLEVTYNARDRTWHPHLHILVDSEYISWDWLRLAWEQVTLGEGTSVYIQKARKGWERELIKYITKASSLMRDDAALREFLGFARRKRFIRTYGSLYNCAVNREESTGPIICRGCGAEMHLEKSCVSFQDVYNQEFGCEIFKKDGKSPPSSSGGTGQDNLLASNVAAESHVHNSESAPGCY